MYTYEIVQDVAPQNPREEFDNLGELIMMKDRTACNFADTTYMYDVYEYMYSEIEDGSDRLFDAYQMATGRNIRGLYGLDLQVAQADACVILEAAYEKDFIYIAADYIAPGAICSVSKAEVYNEYGVKRISQKLRTQIEGYLRSEMDMLHDYIEGNVYGFEVRDENNYCVDSCYGFFGEDGEKQADLEAQNSIKYMNDFSRSM